ncbi:MAG: hypothetical protein DMG26_10170 [Acidobacteria bacterium]|nr:MAG: hypothetical protein DMG25_01115 [Acidobacteriota bacterium]PYV03044.1 MAG: hypothetical protein DMG26_10170 [Acidobacteriota bacterium]PYV24103.1 MAG: hypothetical protein DMG27_13800 [Acidobacteriota bacterium]
MGRNKDLRRKIAACQSVIEAHEEKIRAEQTKPHPSEELLAGWKREIETQKKAIAHLTRRLKREW